MDKVQLGGREEILEARQVLIVEGEARLKMARTNLPDWMAVVDLPAVLDMGEVDWSPCFAKKIILWPNDPGYGLDQMIEVAKILDEDAEQIKLVDFERELKAADKKKLLDWLAKGITDLADKNEPVEPEKKPRKKTAKPKPVSPPAATNGAVPTGGSPVFASPAQVISARGKKLPFHILGQNKGRAYFLKHADGRVLNFTLTSLQKKETLCALARSGVWRSTFGGLNDEGKPIGWPTMGMAAMDHVMSVVEKMPEFDPEITRGRGCWKHKGKIAYNNGTIVTLDGEETDTNYVDGYVYERGVPIRVDKSKQTTDEEGSKLIELLEQCNWVEPHAPLSLAGWIGIAPICGALSWRPHVWITGPHGCGKSTIRDDMVVPALGKASCISIGGNTTEAGLRQTIDHDSLPVVIDETEPGEKSAIATILTLARSASSGDTIVRGSAAQDGAHHYNIRSAFCFAAINPDIENTADESRITMLRLHKSQGKDDKKYLSMMEGFCELFADDFGLRLNARMIELAPVILESIKVVEAAVAEKFNSRRLAQQFGALFGGLHAIRSRSVISKDDALYMVSLIPDSNAAKIVEDDDSIRMVQHFLAQYVDTIIHRGGHMKVSVGELIQRAAEPFSDPNDALSKREAIDQLSRIGFRIVDKKRGTGFQKFALIAKKHPQVRKIFTGTQWKNTYVDRFKDLDGGKNGVQISFLGNRFSTVEVPLLSIMGEMDDEASDGDEEIQGNIPSD